MALVISLAGTAEQDSPFGADDFPATLTNVGDLFTVQLFVYSPTITCTSIAITGTGTVQGGALTNRYQYTTVFFGGTDIEMWSGIVTGTGTVTVTCTFSASVAGLDVAYSPREFTVLSKPAERAAPQCYCRRSHRQRRTMRIWGMRTAGRLRPLGPQAVTSTTPTT
jgi:hypothetical protein